MENNTAKHFALQLGSIITLYVSVTFVLILLFNIINLRFPDAIDSYYEIERASESVRLAIAMVVVFFPTYLFLTRTINKVRRTESSGAYVGITKWLLYLSLLVGGGVLLGDLVAIILAFLNGELTTRFILKAGVLLLIVGPTFIYYLQDARGYWHSREKGSMLYGAAMSIVVAVSLLLGFSHIETPSIVREMKLDEAQITDLQGIQYRIEGVLAMNPEVLPQTLEEVYDGFPIPVAPEDREAYSYEATANGFNLCATFSRNSPPEQDLMFKQSFDVNMPIKNGNDWSYQEGRYCFKRIVN